MKKIRLIYPQWQGGDIARWIPEIEDVSLSARGYHLGAELLDFLSPSEDEKYTVPVSLDYKRVIKDGILDKDDILFQTRSALDILEKASPDKIVTLGGECSVSVVPFTYLNRRYDGDVAVVWIDAHPDITLPGDVYSGYHAMAVTALMGKGDEEIINTLPSRFSPSDILFVGLRDWERDEIVHRHESYGISYCSPSSVSDDSAKILSWLEKCGKSRVVIHFDMDVLDPKDIIAAVGTVDGGLSLRSTVRIINDIARKKELVGITVAEPMPRVAIRLKQMLSELPLI